MIPMPYNTVHKADKIMYNTDCHVVQYRTLYMYNHVQYRLSCSTIPYTKHTNLIWRWNVQEKVKRNLVLELSGRSSGQLLPGASRYNAAFKVKGSGRQKMKYL